MGGRGGKIIYLREARIFFTPPHINFGARLFLKGIFLRATSQVTISQVATSQMCNFPNGNFPKVRLGPLTLCNGDRKKEFLLKKRYPPFFQSTIIYFSGAA